MSRTGVEEKPPWSIVPAETKRRIGEKLGASVVRGSRVWGSYGSGPTFRLRLADGRRAFAKALWDGSNEFERRALARELRNYRELSGLLTPFAPEFFGAVESCGWQVMLLEDLGPQSAPPWRVSDIRAVATGLAEFHRSTGDAKLPEWVPGFEEIAFSKVKVWDQQDSGSGGISGLRAVAQMSDTPDEAMEWLETHAPTLAESGAALFDVGGSSTLIHLDVRSDNLRVVDGALRLFDWPFLSIGPPELDIVAFAQTVTADGGPRHETVMDMYAEAGALRPEVVTASVVMIADLFADLAPRPSMPGLPRLRAWQGAQLKVTLRWAAQRLDLPDPTWVDSISTA